MRIGAGQTVNAQRSVAAHKNEGTLNVMSNTFVRANRVEVLSGGHLNVGTAQEPATNVTFHLDHDDCDYLVESSGFNYRESWDKDPGAAAAAECLKKGEIKVQGSFVVHGVPRTSWTLLTQDCFTAGGSCPSTLDTNAARFTPLAVCCSTIEVEDARLAQHGSNCHRLQPRSLPGRQSTAVLPQRITSITRNGRACSIGLNETTPLPHIANSEYCRDTQWQDNQCCLEVLFERSVTFTCPLHWRKQPGFDAEDNEL